MQASIYKRRPLDIYLTVKTVANMKHSRKDRKITNNLQVNPALCQPRLLVTWCVRKISLDGQ